MIRYALKCAEGHAFEAWFRDSAAFDALAARSQVSCAVCGDARVEKTLMAPSLRGEDRAGDRESEQAARPHADAGPPAAPSGGPSGGAVPAPPAGPSAGPPGAPLSAPATPAERALAGLRRFLSEKADYVGRRFAAEARAIHDGEADERPIWGEASVDEARALREEGVPIAPLPPLPRRDD